MAFFSSSDSDVQVKVTSTADTKGLDQTTDSVNRLEDSGGMGSKAMSALGIAGRAAVVGVTALGAATSVAGGMAIKSAADFEQNRVAFEVMLGSADKARTLMTQIAQFAKETPFELPEVVAGSKQLLAFGFAQEQIIPTMRKLGDIAAGVGVPVGQLTNVFGQVRVAGRLMGQDLLQFTNAGVPLIEALATTMKKPQTEIKKMVEQGQVGFPEVEAAINSLTGSGSKFGGMMDKQSHTFSGVVSNLKDGFGQILRSAVGMSNAGDIVQGGLFDRVKDGAEALLPVVQRLADNAGPFMVVAMDKTIAVASDLVAGFKQVYNQVNDYLGPKLENLWSTFSEKIIPIISRLWHEVIEPLIPVVGTLLVVAIGAVVDALNIFFAVITPIINWMLDNKGVVIALATAFTVLAVAMNFNAIAAAFNAALTSAIVMVETFRLVTIPSALTSMSQFAAGFGPIGVAAMVAAGVIIDAGNKAKAAWDNTQKAIENASTSNDAVIKNLQQLAKTGTPDQQQRAKITLKKLADTGAFAKGTDFAPGGLALVGEQGPELVNLPSGSKVKTASETQDMLGGGGTTVNYNAPIYLQTADAVKQFFALQDRNSVLAGKGLSTVRM